MVKFALITGCSKGGIGDALALEFHQKQIKVIATARDLKKVQHLKDLGIDTLQLDVTSDESVKEAVSAVHKMTGGRLDFLVNNSGAGYSMPLLDSKIEDAKKMFDVNVWAVVTVTQAFSPLLIAGHGKILNIGSGVGYIPVPFMGLYNASKAALGLITDTLRIEMAPLGVQVILVVTALVRTEFFNNIPTPALPTESRYLPIQSQATKAMKGGDMAADAMDAGEYARGVVKNALKTTSNPWHWYGGKAGTFRFASTVFPHTFLDGDFSKQAGLDKLHS